MTENELILFDRLEVIRKANDKYDLEHNAYISFSGGKDSTVLHYLMDEALPGNTIPRVFSNTGIEYNDVVKFVNEIAANDKRITIIYPRQKIKEMLENIGYPFKSKVHSTKLDLWQRGYRNSFSVNRYLTQGAGKFACPKGLLYQFTDNFTLKVSPFCCHELKKKPFAQYSIESNKPIAITGMQKAEGGGRTTLSCIVTKNNSVVKFHPLSPITEEWENWYIQERGIKLCCLYYPPYNFKRTGCKGCPFSLDLQAQLDVMAMYLPAEKRQCEYIWKPVYDEYRRLGYRLRKPDGQVSLFEQEQL